MAICSQSHDTSSSDEEAEEIMPASKKQKHIQKFRHEWLLQREFKDWLTAPTKYSKEARCSLCNKPVPSHRSSLIKHSQSQMHINKARSKQSSPSVKDIFEKQSDLGIYKENTEVQVSAFIAEHNLPFTLSGPLLNLIKSRAPTNTAEKAALAKIKLNDTKCVNIVRQGLGLYFAKELVTELRHSKFTIIPDETTDVSTEKQLGLVVTYFNYDTMETVSQFFDLISVHSCTAEGLYNTIKQSLLEKSIPMNNIIGYSSDTTNVMFGDKESVVSLLKKDVPHVVAIRCSCHMIHLCASYACLKMSVSLEDMLRNVHAHFSRSSQRTHSLEEFQKFCNVPIHKLLSLSQTRWLSLENVVNRVLEQWAALQLYFTDLVAEKKDPLNTVTMILQILNNKFMKAQLEFMSFQLSRLNAFNTFFQRKEPALHHLKGEVNKILNEVLCDFIKLDVVRHECPFSVDIHEPRKRVDIDHVYVGVAATSTLSECYKRDPNGTRQVRVTCRNFMVELVEQIRRRFSEIQNECYDHLDFLLPVNAVKCHPPSLVGLYESFPFLKDVARLDLVDREWRKQAIEEPHILKPNLSDIQFWRERLGQQTINGELKYGNLCKVIGCMMTLPFANAPVERLFSNLKLIKTDQRNSLKRESIVGLLHGKEGMASHKISSDQLNVQNHPKLLKLMRNIKSNATDSEAHDIIASNMAS